MLKFITLAVLTSGLAFSNHSTQLFKLKTEHPLELRHHLEEAGFDVVGTNRATGEVSVLSEEESTVIGEQARLLKTRGFTFSILSREWSEPYFSYAARNNPIDAVSYFGVSESIEALRQLETTYPNWVRLYNLTQFLGASKTEEGNDIFAIQVSTNPAKVEDEPKILIIGQHHARELTTQHAVLDSAEDLLKRAKGGDSKALQMIESKAVWFVPVLNPDGLNHVLKEERMWRKNQAHNQDGTRGVDLNRNYDFKWGTCGTNSDLPKSEVFKGYKANSEPEILLMHSLNEKLHFQYSISYHSYGNEVLNPYVCGDLQEQNTYFRMRDAFVSTLGFGKRPPSSSGEDHEYHYNKFGTLAFILEIGTEFQPPFQTYESVIRPTVLKVLPVIHDQGFANTRHINVVDDETNAPLKTVLSISQIAFKEGEKRQTDSFGSYYWELPKTALELNVMKNGYVSETVSLNAEQSSIEIRMKKSRFGLNGYHILARFFPFLNS